MTQNPNNQGPVIPKQQQNIGSVASQLCAYIWALVRLAAVLIVAAAVCGAAYVALRAIVFAVQIVTQAMGI